MGDYVKAVCSCEHLVDLRYDGLMGREWKQGRCRGEVMIVRGCNEGNTVGESVVFVESPVCVDWHD